jgi:hypothetical protein
LLDDAQTVRYGAVGEDEVAQPDEEELEREREALNRITMQATEYVASVWCETCPAPANIADFRSMIDVLHPNGVTINPHLTPNNSIRNKPDEASSQSTITTSNQAEDAEEQAWLDSITSTEPGSITHIKALQKGALVLDMGQLREAVPPPSARKPSRAGIGRM